MSSRPKTDIERYIDDLYQQLPWWLRPLVRIQSAVIFWFNRTFRPEAFSRHCKEVIERESPEVQKMFADHLIALEQNDLHSSK